MGCHGLGHLKAREIFENRIKSNLWEIKLWPSNCQNCESGTTITSNILHMNRSRVISPVNLLKIRCLNAIWRSFKTYICLYIWSVVWYKTYLIWIKYHFDHSLKTFHIFKFILDHLFEQLNRPIQAKPYPDEWPS